MRKAQAAEKAKKDYEKAEELLHELVNDTYPVYEEKDLDKWKENKQNQNQQQPFKVGESIVDVIPFYMDLLTISLAEKEFDKAENYLNELRTRDKKFEIRTYFSEAKILLGRGKVKKALEVLTKAKNNKPNSEVWYQIGKIYMQTNRFEDAKEAFENALEYEVDKAKFHQSLATCLIRLGEYEEAAEHALTAIELVKYFPEAHYTLGEALEKMGDLVNAKLAYDTAAKLKPETHHRAEKAIENVNIKLKDKSSFKYHKEQIVVVSGLPRSGTSLMMQMLHKGGIKALTDENRKADDSNPKGYFEYEPVMSIHKDNSWLPLAKDKSVKVVAPLLKFLDPKFRYKVIFMNRDLTEIVKSQQKMIGKDPETLPTRLFEAYKKHLKQVEIWKNREPGVELMYLNYRDVLENKEESIDKINSFVGLDLNKIEMTKCIDKSLYRNKVEV